MAVLKHADCVRATEQVIQHIMRGSVGWTISAEAARSACVQHLSWFRTRFGLIPRSPSVVEVSETPVPC